MISVITPTYKTDMNVLARTFGSLKRQTFPDWEWIVYDDSPGLEVYRQLYGFCSDERYKVRVFRPHHPSGGKIGYAKRSAFLLGTGDILVELDHDDELTPDALAEVQVAFFSNPAVNFVYSDCSEVYPDGTSHRYPPGWAFGFGSEYWHEQRKLWVMRAPPINRTTMSHIVSMPNHVRAWRSDFYRLIGGHDPDMNVADDYDLMVRTLLATDYVHIPKLLYLQHISPTSAQRVMNAEIQSRVADIAAKYRDAIIRKFPA